MTRSGDVRVNGTTYGLEVEDDGAMTITRHVPGTGYVVVGRGTMSDAGQIECAAHLGDDVYDALEAAWAAED